MLLQATGRGASHLPYTFLLAIGQDESPGGKALFPSFYDTKVNNTLKAVLNKLHVPYANRYSSHGFRRGAANELKTKGSQWSTIASIVEWESLSFLGYVDITPELDRDLSKLLIEVEDLDSDLDDEVMSLGLGPRPDVCASDFGR